MLNFKRFTPFTNRVLIKRFDMIKKSKGGVILADASQQENQVGTVVSTGPGLTLTNGVFRAINVKAGDTVLLPTYSGVKLTMADKEEYWVYRDDDIIGVVSEPTTV